MEVGTSDETLKAVGTESEIYGSLRNPTHIIKVCVKQNLFGFFLARCTDFSTGKVCPRMALLTKVVGVGISAAIFVPCHVCEWGLESGRTFSSRIHHVNTVLLGWKMTLHTTLRPVTGKRSSCTWTNRNPAGNPLIAVPALIACGLFHNIWRARPGARLYRGSSGIPTVLLGFVSWFHMILIKNLPWCNCGFYGLEL